MDIGENTAFDSFKEGTKEAAEVLHEKTKEFHENYISKITPDLGKYGDAAAFAAELLPGVSEYNAIREGDWQAFAIAAGIDIAAVAVGAATAGAGYAAVKGASSAAKAGVKLSVKEVAEASTKIVVKETTEAGAQRVSKEIIETSAEKAVSEIAEAGTKKAVRAGVEKKAIKVTESSAEKVEKEVIEEASEEASVKTTEVAQIVRNKIEGTKKEELFSDLLHAKYKNEDVKIIREAYLRDSNGAIIRDTVTGEARRIDFIVAKKGRVLESFEVTSETAPKGLQMAKEYRIREIGEGIGGIFIKDPDTKELIKFGKNIVTDIRRLHESI